MPTVIGNVEFVNQIKLITVKTNTEILRLFNHRKTESALFAAEYALIFAQKRHNPRGNNTKNVIVE